MIHQLQNDALGKLILRLTVGGLMLFHGIAKIRDTGPVDQIANALSQTGLPSFIAYGVYVGEVLAPVMILLGVFCRYGTMLVMVNMLVAILLMHTADMFAINKFGGWQLELQGFYLFGAIAIMFLGSGKYAINPD